MGSRIPKSIQKAQWQVLMLLLEALPCVLRGAELVGNGYQKGIAWMDKYVCTVCIYIYINIHIYTQDVLK